MALTTAADYKAWSPSAATASDANLTAWIAQATAVMEDYTGTQFESAAWTEEWSGDHTQRRKLSRRPATAVSSVSIVAQDGTTTALPATSYRITQAGAFLDRYPFCNGRVSAYAGDGWPRDPIGIGGPLWRSGTVYRAEMTVGFASGSADLLRAKAAVHQFLDIMLADRGKPGLQSESMLSYSYTRLTADEKYAVVRDLLSGFSTGSMYA